MSFSRFSVLAIFLMMVMSAFVALPTYDVGADEHRSGGPYLNAFPTGSGGDIADYEMSSDSANITVEATELVEGTSYTISWEIRYHPDWYHTGWWDFSAPPTSVQYFIGPEVFDDLDAGCYVFTGWLYDNDAGVMIEEETWPFTLDIPLSDCEGMDECPFDDREGTPCEAEVCEGEGHESEECQDYVESYCEANDDPGCYFGGPSTFVCGNGDEIPFHYVNDGVEDCSDGSDEQQYDSEGELINWFDCHDGSMIPVNKVNNGIEDCPDGEDEGYGGDDYYDDFGPSEAHIDVHMIDLANWEAYATGTFDPMWSDDTRAEIAYKCAEMMGTSDTEITSECFDEWVAMTMGGPGMGYEPDRGCPHDMDEDTCDDFREACGPDSLSKLTCFRMIFDYCDDHDDEICHEGIASEDDGGPMFEALFAYEDEEIDSDEFLDILTAWIYGEHGGDPALYDTHTFTITTDDEGFYSLHPNFGSYWEGGHDFICGNGDEIPFHYVNDGYGDCPDGADEQWYDSGTPGDTSDDCQMWNDADCEGTYVNWFDCQDGSEIWIVEVNNGVDNCPYGEDEAYDGSDGSDYWYGYVFLYTGNFTDVPDSTENIIGAAVEVCGYEDEANKAGVHCESALEGLLAAGDYTVVTAGTCYYEWTDEDGDGEYDESDELSCYNYGDYTHVITNESGDVVDEIDGTVEYDLNHTMVMTREHYALRDESSNFFPLYDTHAFTVGTDGFNGAIVSAQYQCHDEDGDGVDDDCYSADMSLYLYEGSFDPADTHANILDSNDDVWDDGLDCPVGDEPEYYCMYSRLKVELSAGDYVVVTAGFDTWSEGYYVNDIVTDDGIIIESWDGKLKGSYWEWEWNETDEGLYRTVAYDGSVYDLAFEEFWNEAYDFEWEGNQKAVEEEFGSVNDLYEIYGDVLETEGSDCDGCTGNLDTMDADTSFDITDQNEFENWAYNYNFDYYYFQFMDDNENGVYDSGEIYAVSSEGYDETGGQEVLVEGDERTHMPRPWEYSDQDGEFFFNSMVANLDEYLDGTLTADVAAGNIVSIFYEADAGGVFNEGDDYDDDVGGEDCPFDSISVIGTLDFCYEIGPYCDEWSGMYDPWRCGSESAHYCLEDGVDDEGCAEIDEIIADCDAGEAPQEICEAFLNFDHDAYHAEMDDEPVTLDGVEGVEDPDDWDDMMTPSSENIVGGLAEYEGTSIMFHSSFTITFDSVDDSLASHVFVIPSNEDADDDYDYDDDDLDWQITFTVTDGYQIDSCDGCDDINDATYSDDGHTVFFTYNSDATHDVAITFSITAEPGPDCDYVIGIDASGFAFDPVELTINVGETVCWQWADASDAHNIVETVGAFSADMDLTGIDVGFHSGPPSNTMDFRHTFTDDDMTHYYVCVPHAATGMVGSITVGEGTPDDPVEEIEESGLPSVGFIVGALVLVGAAGLRRRIH